MRSIILCGFMGCGKTTVGQRLAERSGRVFLDLDQQIEKQAGMPITSIFAQFGEGDFRRREREACRALGARENLVLATGGGALCDPDNAAVLSRAGDIVLLDAPLPLLLKRLEGDTTRPLLARPDREAAAAALYAQRMPLYRAAAARIVDASDDPDTVARAILDTLGEASRE